MIKIISDSTCDLTKELLEEYDISILPLHVMLGEKDLLDGVTVTPDEIYEWADANKTTPKTSAPSIEDAIDLIKPYVENGDNVIYFSISKEMSTSINVINLAVDELEANDKVFVIDSGNLSTGVGHLVLEAATMVKEGMDVKDIVAKIEELKPRVRASFVVDTLTYLHRGGRCGSVAALAGGVLKLHPKIVVEDGKMGATKKYRGKMDSVILSYAKEMEEEYRNAKTDRIFITHSGCDEKIIESVSSYLRELDIFKEIIVTRAGSVISSHCGYGTLGILYIAK